MDARRLFFADRGFQPLVQSRIAISQQAFTTPSGDPWFLGVGNSVMLVKHTLQSGQQFLAEYMHVRPTVGEGDHVVAGRVIAKVGPWYNDTHLHFGIHPGLDVPYKHWGMMDNSDWNGTNGFVDPVAWLTTQSPKGAQPAPVRYNLNFQTSGKYMTQEADGTINVNRPNPSMWELFTLTDLNAGTLNSGDSVTIQSWRGWYLSARYDLGHLVFAEPQYGFGAWETFTIFKVAVSGNRYYTVSGPIGQGDRVALQCSELEFLSARFDRTNYPLSCDKTYFDAWETFTITLR